MVSTGLSTPGTVRNENRLPEYALVRVKKPSITGQRKKRIESSLVL